MQPDPAPLTLWCGGYTDTMDGAASGVGVLTWDGIELVWGGTVVETSSPSWLSRRGSTLYAADEAQGRVTAFRIGHENLDPIGSVRTSGPYPCHLSIADDTLLVSNYGDGSIDRIPLNDDGSLGQPSAPLRANGSGPRPQQEGPHAHSTLSVAPGVTLSADLGTDEVHVHEGDASSLRRTRSIRLPSGTGPRDLIAVGERIFLLAEFGSRLFELSVGASSVNDDQREAAPMDAVLASAPLVSDPVDTDQAAGLVAGQDGRFLYAGLRGSNRIAVVDAETLSPVGSVPCGGDWPRHLAIIDDVLFVSNQRSNSVAAFTIDSVSGMPEFAAAAGVPTPTFVRDTREW